MNPCLQYFIGLVAFTQKSPFDANMMTRIRKRISTRTLQEVNNIIIGKQNADVEFGAKVEVSEVNGFLRVEELRWDVFTERTTSQDSVENYRKA